jgi:hypothetical protein
MSYLFRTNEYVSWKFFKKLPTLLTVVPSELLSKIDIFLLTEI